ncbi:helix-hairpin-helix domain-containing protein [Methylobacterium sp. Leaf113]|uniref:helix-hairpin-helix domain-containing protein n=1 Tax=Methylobacterium sp. Leaf113 TaxID=1736259 RepID=UPI0009E892D9|nr:helix-hairpin-helix domain-containing protein [Methylobacterium sp. Leaf113]
MLSGSAILRVGILIVVAAVLAGIIQFLRPHGDGATETATEPSAETRTVTPPPSVGKAGTQAVVPPAVTRPVSPVVPAPAPQASPMPAPASPPAPTSPPMAAPAPTPTADARMPAFPPSSPPASPAPGRSNGHPARPASPFTGEQAIDNAAETAGPRGVAVIDLNTGSVSELNALRGGGMIGRAIAQKRPYASVGELLSKRVLSRAVYERIKDQVTVR